MSAPTPDTETLLDKYYVELISWTDFCDEIRKFERERDELRQGKRETVSDAKIDLTFVPKFKISDPIRKPKGYAFDGVVVAVFTTVAMEVRVVAEMQTESGVGMLHIFSEAQLEKRSAKTE